MPILIRGEIMPTQFSSPSPTGSYTFGVFSDDTMVSSIFIGLIISSGIHLDDTEINAYADDFAGKY